MRIRPYFNRDAGRYGWFAWKRQEYWLRIHVGPLGILVYGRGWANLKDAQTTTRARFNDVASRWIPDEVADAMEAELFDKTTVLATRRAPNDEVNDG